MLTTYLLTYQQAHYSDKAAHAQRRERSEYEKKWDSLSSFDKALTWTKDNKFGVVIGSWVASMGASWLYIQSQPLSFSQKLVQARVWAQGLTVASLIGIAALTTIPSAGDTLLSKSHSADDQSWRKIIQEQADATAHKHAMASMSEAKAKASELAAEVKDKAVEKVKGTTN